MPRIHLSNIVTALAANTIGSKVHDPAAFLSYLQDRLFDFVFPPSGQGIVTMDSFLTAKPGMVTAGVAKRNGIPSDGLMIRSHRGEDMIFAQRVYAAHPESLVAIVYTMAAYCTDPEVEQDEYRRIVEATADPERDVVLVAVLASAGPKPPPLTSIRFVRNLAGGNKVFSAESGYTLDAAIADAKAIVEYEKNWIGVAD